MAHTFLAHRLTGVYYLDHISASYSEPLYDVGKNRWIKKWVEDIAPGLPMPELKWPTEVIGHITVEGAQRSGLRHDRVGVPQERAPGPGARGGLPGGGHGPLLRQHAE